MGSGDWFLELVEVPVEITEFFELPRSSFKRSTYCVWILYIAEVSVTIITNIKKYWDARKESHFK